MYMENENKRNSNFLKDTLKGLPLGVSAAVPGVSAGTIAIIEKCYDLIIDSIAGFKKSFKTSFLALLPFLLGYAIGGLAALLGIKAGYNAAPFSITGLFAGFIIGSLPSIFVELKKGETLKEKLLLLLPLLISFLVVSSIGVLSALLKVDFGGAIVNHEWWIYVYVFLAGAIGAGSCLVPGVSGSMCLMVMGLYFPINEYFLGFKEGTAFYMTGDWVSGIILLLCLGLGALVGLVVASKAMKNLLDKHHDGTYYAIVGLILGSLVSMFINNKIFEVYLDASHPIWDYIVGIALTVVGAVITFILYKVFAKKSEK